MINGVASEKRNERVKADYDFIGTSYVRKLIMSITYGMQIT